MEVAASSPIGLNAAWRAGISPAATVAVFLLGSLLVVVPPFQNLLGPTIPPDKVNLFGLLIYAVGAGVGIAYYSRGNGGWSAAALTLAVVSLGSSAAIGIAVIAFALGRHAGLGPVRGFCAWAAGNLAGLLLVLFPLGPLNFYWTWEDAIGGIGIGAAVASWFIVHEEAVRRGRHNWTAWVAAVLVLALAGLMLAGVSKLAITSPEQAVVRVVNLSPGMIRVSESLPNPEETPPSSGQVALACGASTLVRPPPGSHGPWWVYAGPAVSQVSGGGAEPYQVTSGIGAPRVLLAPAGRSWIERWLSPHCP